MEKLRVLIVDDEAHGRANLSHLLKTYCQEIRVVGEAASGEEALQLVDQLKPEAVFLDIRMPKMDGFHFLKEAQPRRFSVVFVTAHDNYGIQAVKASAMDYLLKPISIDELRQAVAKLLQQRHVASSAYQESLTDLTQRLAHPESPPERITLPHGHDWVIIDLKDIIRLEAEDNYAFIHLQTRKHPLLVPRTLKHMEELLPEDRFVRTHRSHIIHLAFLKAFVKEEGGVALLHGGIRVPVSRRRQADFLKRIRQEP
ncbi:MAG: DNA-binding response regulator [Bacteroidetes bacterium]|nr:MAG: DNA-binding response regulator [Bacteroidota bacterium]